jgi:hypothetical protein
MESCYLTSHQVKILSDGLKLNRSLITLDLSHNYIGDYDGSLIVYNLLPHKTIVNLNLSNNLLKRQTCRRVKELLETNESLKLINLANNPLDERCAKLLHEAVLSMNTSLISFGDIGTNLLMGVRRVHEINTCLKQNSMIPEARHALIKKQYDLESARKYYPNGDYKVLSDFDEDQYLGQSLWNLKYMDEEDN